ncbi:MAG TPA: SRPBCC domain-containing protein [Dinghuibacter sp.]|jgi:uncharacterized protein YndB with AHSA1/START domain|uniref:SRPBCC family protein n=1 Tax=Dinghuibacter sp. TaxID=2024697 RepID=UPI002C90DE34|nr:SRPBCC domain-containing protein [Dinghuibacter sp.]HTJ11195.1 SRPBCC domain-containing protein [Dinghuibacter sp.]
METTYEVAPSGNQLTAKRTVNAPREKVWRAWTDATLLDKWWAPKPYRAETKSMNFTEGGRWHYAMVGPGGDKHWCKSEYKTIQPQERIVHVNAFSDEEGNTVPAPPSHLWQTEFTATPTGTSITVVLTFDNPADLDRIMEMGFKEGFAAALGNLDETLAA